MITLNLPCVKDKGRKVLLRFLFQNRKSTGVSYSSLECDSIQMTIILFPCVPIDGRGLSQSVRVEEGKNATLSCNATGNPVLKISWFKDGSYITRSSTINLSADQKHLTINNESNGRWRIPMCGEKQSWKL